LRSLVEGLYIATSNGTLKWAVVPNSSTYVANIASSRVEIGAEGGELGEADIRISVYDSSGNNVDSFDDNYFKGMKPKNIPYDGYYSAMAALLDSARRSATGADKVVDNILNSLGTPKVDDGDFSF
jgi:hypothetical protein